MPANIPAITIGSKLTKGSLYRLLVASGVRGLAPEPHYGLSLVLGGAELTMEQLAMLYAALANGGRANPLRYRSSDPSSPGQHLLSPEASFLTLQMLAHNPRPDAIGLSLRAGQKPPTYWKTGTSNGYRDAWSVGIVGPYVLVV